MSRIEPPQTLRAARTQPDYPLWMVFRLVVMGTLSAAQATVLEKVIAVKLPLAKVRSARVQKGDNR